MLKNKKQITGGYTLISLMLFTFFISCIVMLILIGTDIYEKIGNDIESNFNRRVPLSYIATKIRQYDKKDGITIENKDGVSILVLKEVINNKAYETWVYSYQGGLREVFLESGQTISLGDGENILPLERLDFERVTDNLINIKYSGKDGKPYEMFLNLRVCGLE